MPHDRQQVKSVSIPLPLVSYQYMSHVIRFFFFCLLLAMTALTTQVKGQVNWMSWEEAQAKMQKHPANS